MGCKTITFQITIYSLLWILTVVSNFFHKIFSSVGPWMSWHNTVMVKSFLDNGGSLSLVTILGYHSLQIYFPILELCYKHLRIWQIHMLTIRNIDLLPLICVVHLGWAHRNLWNDSHGPLGNWEITTALSCGNLVVAWHNV